MTGIAESHSMRLSVASKVPIAEFTSHKSLSNMQLARAIWFEPPGASWRRGLFDCPFLPSHDRPQCDGSNFAPTSARSVPAVRAESGMNVGAAVDVDGFPPTSILPSQRTRFSQEMFPSTL